MRKTSPLACLRVFAFLRRASRGGRLGSAVVTQCVPPRGKFGVGQVTDKYDCC